MAPFTNCTKDFQYFSFWAKPKESRLELASEDGLIEQKHTGHAMLAESIMS